MWNLEEVLMIIISLMSVAFFTLLERKILGLSQTRLGPNKVSYMGLLQPVFDGIKLFLKQKLVVATSQMIFFSLSPTMVLLMFLLIWVLVIPWEGNFSYKYSSLMFFILLSMSAYSIILMGWSSASNFSKLGSLRGMLQSLSFEVAFILAFLLVLGLLNSLSFNFLVGFSFDVAFLWMIICLIMTLVESNRAPFDLLEGESELISGFNIEMSSLFFVFLFLSEYGSILVIIMILLSSFNTLFSQLVMASMLLLVRSCFPRLRYDSLMEIMWQSILPIVMIGLVFLPEGYVAMVYEHISFS